MPIYYSNIGGTKGSEIGIGNYICDCCGTRIADPDNGTDKDWDEDDYGDEICVDVPMGFIEGKHGIFIQEGQIDNPQDNGRYVVDHIKTKNGWISVKVEYVW